MNKNNKNLTQSSFNKKLYPYWITGFADAESSFSIRIIQDKSRKTGWRILPIFCIDLHEKDLLLLERIRDYFNAGNIYKHKSNAVIYTVQSFYELNNNIIPHFEKYPLLSIKRKNFFLFKLVLNLLNNKAQSSHEGLQKIINIRASMNNGLSNKLLEHFPDTIPYPYNIESYSYNIDPYWLSGFVDGEGLFYVKPKKKSFGVSISISQHIKDEVLLNNISSYLQCGLIEKPTTRSEANFRVYKIKDICEKIIPHFEKYPLQGIKALDFQDFVKVAKILYEQPGKMTQENFTLINTLKLNMNRGRKL